MDNADLLTNAAALIERYRAEATSTSSEIDRLQARLEVLNETLDALTGTRRGRPRRKQAPAEPNLLPDMQPADYMVVPEPAS
jgi:hypothetical protein